MSSRKKQKSSGMDVDLEGDKVVKQRLDKEGEVIDDEEECDDESSDDQDDGMKDDISDADHASNDAFMNQELQINFECLPPHDDDYEGMRMLLSQLWLKEAVNLSDLAKLLMSQQSICSVIKQIHEEDEEIDSDMDEDDVFGVTSMVPLSVVLTGAAHEECVSQINSVIEKRVRAGSTTTSAGSVDKNKDKLLSLLNDFSKVGLILNERFVNIPPKIALPVYQQLIEDIKPNKDKYETFILIAKIMKPKEELKKKQQKQNLKKDSKSHDSDSGQELIYLNAEEELLDGLVEEELRVDYSVANMCDSDSLGNNWSDEAHLYEPRRRIYAFDWNVLDKFLLKMKEELK